jgi:hypothetical protein
VELGLIQVDLCAPGRPLDQITALVLKQAKDDIKDALTASAEGHGGKLSSWQDDSGTFLFLIEGPGDSDACCRAALEMLEQFSSLGEGAQPAAELGHPIRIRIACDYETVAADPEARDFPGGIGDALRQHRRAVGADNQVIITERLFGRLKGPLQAGFVKWKHSQELGVDLYSAAEASAPVGPRLARPDSYLAPAAPAAEPPARAEDVPAPARPGGVSGALRSRMFLVAAGAAVLALALFGLVRLVVALTAAPAPAPPPQPTWPELVQSEDWRGWRKQVHEKLSGDKAPDRALADALVTVKLPPRPEHAAEALRRDQAIGDVLMSYPAVKDLLWDRFGIDKQNFLGTGLSKPYSAEGNYGAATVHEYLIKNYYADSKAVCTRTLDPVNRPDDMRLTVADLVDDVRRPDRDKDELVKEIVRRVKEKDATTPPVIRFARFNAVEYSRRLGRPARRYVFASNLAEVWNMRVRDAADLSGDISEKGDTMYLWVFVPNHASEVVPATWDQVLNHLPAWLGESDKD